MKGRGKGKKKVKGQGENEGKKKRWKSGEKGEGEEKERKMEEFTLNGGEYFQKIWIIYTPGPKTNTSRMWDEKEHVPFAS